MKAKKIFALALAALMLGTSMACPAFAAGEALAAVTSPSDDIGAENDAVAIYMGVKGDMTYGSPVEVTVDTYPENTQYIGVLMGTSGEARGFITLSFSDKIRTLLKLIPMPKIMSVTPEQEEEFTLYAYIKQLIDGNEAGVLLRVADEVVSVMDSLKFYIPALDDIANGLRTALDLIREFIPDTSGTRIYLDEPPTAAGGYIAGAVALESTDVNTAGVVMFNIKPRTEGVRMYWAADMPASLTAAEAAAFDKTAVAEADGQILTDGAHISYTYKSAGFFASLSADESTEVPTEAGEYIQTATLSGNYSCEPITRRIKISG